MANVAVLVPRVEMQTQAEEVAAEMGFRLQEVQVIATPQAVSAARKAVESGAQIIIARGLQAAMIKRATQIPVIEIRLTGQELGLLVTRAKKMVGGEEPHLGVVGFKDNFANMDHFEELYGIKLSTYFVEDLEAVQQAVEQAVADGVELLIGGDFTLELAAQKGLPALFNQGTSESIRETFLIAEKVAFAIDLEKKAAAQFDSLLGTTLDGVLRLRADGSIVAANRIIQDYLARPESELQGQPIGAVIPALDEAFLTRLGEGEDEQYTSAVAVGEVQFLITAMAIELTDGAPGYLLNLHRMGGVTPEREGLRRDMLLSGFMAQGNFSQIRRSGKAVARCIELAKMYALSKSPVAIYGEQGTEVEILAQAIHNNSLRRNQPYVAVNCYDAAEENQSELLFGREGPGGETVSGALAAANFGTIHIAEAERLTPQSQYRLLKVIEKGTLFRDDFQGSLDLDVRIIISAGVDLTELMAQGLFRRDLYDYLQALMLILPPLRQTPEAIASLTEIYLRENIDRYSKYVTLTEAAQAYLAAYPWPGNLLQLSQFCERLVLTATRRSLDAGYVEQLLTSLYPTVEVHENVGRVTVYRHPQAREIVELMEEHGGRRAAVAEALGISTTTLWRRMKKYGIAEKYK